MKIKTLMMTAAAAMLGIAATTATADTVVVADTATPPDHIWNDPGGWWQSTYVYEKDYHNLYNANELTFDLFGSFLGQERRFTDFPNTSIRKGRWGGGIGANYFWSRDVGIGVDTSAQTESRHFVDHVGGNLIVRLPIDVIRLAPYVFAGGGRKFNPQYAWFGDAGAGLEFRLNRHTGLFADARYIWVDRTRTSFGASRDEALLRSGFRLAF
ncbi:MAG: hypothetical protein JWQ71_4882 [Pedosphaera sp.]|nr:hypothetical protein [Pedosphaera sp.]